MWARGSPRPSNALRFRTTCWILPSRRSASRSLGSRSSRGTSCDPSPARCFIPVDVFAPAPPARLAAVADQGGISLIWEPNAEPDVTGYMVLRGDASDATLQPLTPIPVAEPRFRDTHVTAGKKYVYAVVALDSRLPVANVSGESNRVEETAR